MSFDRSHDRCTKTHGIRRIVESDLYDVSSRCCIRTSFNLPDCATSPAQTMLPAAYKIMVRVSSGGSPKHDSMPAIIASFRAFPLAERDRRNIARIVELSDRSRVRAPRSMGRFSIACFRMNRHRDLPHCLRRHRWRQCTFDASPHLNSRIVGDRPGCPANCVGMNEFGTDMLGADLEAFSRRARARCTIWNVSR